MSQFTGKVAIVTGGSRGIGAGVAKDLAKHGALVTLTYISNPAKADAVVKGIEAAGGKAVAVRADCATFESAKELVDASVKAWGKRIDLIVNNAGCGDDIPFNEITEESFNRMFYTNVRFPLLLAREAEPYLQQKARVVNVGSVAAQMDGFDLTLPEGPMYTASKAAVSSVTRSIAAAYGHQYLLTCNTINPGPVRTDMWETTIGKDELEPMITSSTLAAPRIAEVQDIVDIVRFLLSEESRWVTANTTCANGGYMLLN